MANLYEILANAEGGQALTMLGREFGLTPEQTEAAVTALLPAISTGLKQSTATPEGLGNLFGLMGQQRDLQTMYDDPATAFGREGRAAGNDALSVMFGSPDVSRAVADQAQDVSGVGAAILKKMLPVLAGLVISGMMRGGSGQAAPAPSAPPTSPSQGGGLGDILGQIFGRGGLGRPGRLVSRFPCRAASRFLFRPRRAGSPPPAAICSATFYASSRRGFGRGA
jgi:hypothetical protein